MGYTTLTLVYGLLGGILRISYPYLLGVAGVRHLSATEDRLCFVQGTGYNV